MLVRQRSFFSRFALFEKDDDEGNDDGRGGGGGGRSAADLRAAGIAAAKARYNNDLDRAVETLYDDNYTLRTKNRKLLERAEKAEALVPKDGKVITKEQADTLAAYEKLGPPDQLVPKTQLDEANARIAEIDEGTRNDSAADVLRWNRDVLRDLIKLKELKVELKDETADGKPVKVVYVRPANDDKAPLEKLQKYVEEKLPTYLPSLKVAPEGVKFPNQQSGESGAPKGGVVDRFIEQQNAAAAARPNPLAPTPAAAPPAAPAPK